MMHWTESASYRKYVNRNSNLYQDFSSMFKALVFLLIISSIVPLTINLFKSGQLSFAFTLSDFPEYKLAKIQFTLISILLIIILLSLFSAYSKRYTIRKVNLGYFRITLTANNWWNKDIIYESYELYSLTDYEFKTKKYLNNEFEVLALHLEWGTLEVYLDSSINKVQLRKNLDQIIIMKPREDSELILDDLMIG